jgi:hypothetical protein
MHFFFLVSISIVNSPSCFRPIIIAILRENIDAAVSSFFLRMIACCTAYSALLLTVPPSKQNFLFLFFPPHYGVIKLCSFCKPGSKGTSQFLICCNSDVG